WRFDSNIFLACHQDIDWKEEDKAKRPNCLLVQTEEPEAFLFQDFNVFPKPFLQSIGNRLVVGLPVPEQQSFNSTNCIETLFSRLTVSVMPLRAAVPPPRLHGLLSKPRGVPVWLRRSLPEIGCTLCWAAFSLRINHLDSDPEKAAC